MRFRPYARDSRKCEAEWPLFPWRHETLEFLEPVLDNDHLRHGRRLPLLLFRHEKALRRVVGQVIATYGLTEVISGLVKKRVRFAGWASVNRNIHDPHLSRQLFRASIKKLFAVS